MNALDEQVATKVLGLNTHVESRNEIAEATFSGYDGYVGNTGPIFKFLWNGNSYIIDFED